VLQLAKDYRCGYIIVRKDECLTSLGRECDEHALTTNHKKNCVRACRGQSGDWVIEQRYEWFNSKYLGNDVVTNVLRFCERKIKGDEEERYRCEWLFSWRLSSTNCALAVRQARSRWGVEDLFNTMKNRDFELKHDYSRDYRSCCNWQGLALFAFGIFELFRFSEAVTQRGDWSQKFLAIKLLGQLLHRRTEDLFSEQSLASRVQFRYNFVVEHLSINEFYTSRSDNLLETG
jgi:hypothetical protein